MTKESASRPRLSLAGEWQLAFDPAAEGIARGWPGAGWPADRADTVQVPAAWDVTHPDAEGVGFYRRTFAVPASWSEKVVLLHCGGAAYRAEVWVNGQFAGSHEGAYTPFWLDVTRLLRAEAENDIVVRVAGLSRTREIDGMILKHAPAAKQAWYYIYGGLWGEVYLEACPWLAVQAAQVEPDLQRESALVEVTLHNRRVESRLLEVRLSVVRPDGIMAAEQGGRVPVPPGVVRLAYRVPLPRPWPWHYDNPHLYRLHVAVDDGAGQVDQLTATFGMRDFTVQDGQFILNGRPVCLRGVLLQPNYPIGLIAPPDREMMVREITLMKAAGFNLIRSHLRPAAPGFLDLADKMGMLIYAETSLAWIRDSPRMLDHGRREVQALIERDFNHPSVVFWGLLNENVPAATLTSDALVRHARALDPTRVIVDNSGGSMAVDQDFGWIDRASVVPSRVRRGPSLSAIAAPRCAPIRPGSTSSSSASRSSSAGRAGRLRVTTRASKPTSARSKRTRSIPAGSATCQRPSPTSPASTTGRRYNVHRLTTLDMLTPNQVHSRQTATILAARQVRQSQALTRRRDAGHTPFTLEALIAQPLPDVSRYPVYTWAGPGKASAKQATPLA